MSTSILIHDGRDQAPAAILADMYRLRRQVFHDRMRWDVDVRQGYEFDLYDALAPVFGIAVDGTGQVIGCWRLMPTTGPYMLRDIFPQLLHGHSAPSARQVWEISRFAVLPPERGPSLDHFGAVRDTTVRLLDALFAYALREGIRRVVAVTDLRFERILGRAGLSTERYGPPMACGVTRAVAGWADVTSARLDEIRSHYAEAA